jgi:integrase
MRPSKLKVLPVKSLNKTTGVVTTYHQIDYRVAGKRVRRYFETAKEAEKELKEIKTKLANEGKDALNMSHSLRVMATEGEKALLPFGKTVRDAVNHYVAYLQQTQKSITVDALITEYMSMQKSRNRSHRHLKDLENRYQRFSQSFGGRTVSDITSKEVEQWLISLGQSPVSFNNFRERIGFLFGFAIKNEYLVRNPLDHRIEKMPEPEKDAEIFSVEGLSALLSNAPPAFLPILAIGAFAGLRTAELLRLDWSEVNLATKQIRVRAAKAKTAKNRWIDMEPNLVEWLLPLRGKIGPLWNGSEMQFHQGLTPLFASLGFKRPVNGLRHSFASYHLAANQNQNQLADILGHTNSKLIFSNYRNLVTREEGLRYFQIKPPAPAENVVPMAAA